jgi:hypothetical protein
MLSDKNVLQIVDQAADPYYSPQIETASSKKRAAGGMRKRSMHRMSQLTDRAPVSSTKAAGDFALAAKGADATVHRLKQSETIEGGTDDFR